METETQLSQAFPATGNEKECNLEVVGEAFSDENDPEEFEVTALGAVEERNVCETVSYCAKWKQRSGLYLAKEFAIRRAYAHKKELGLFSLFLNGTYINCLRVWTRNELIRRGKRSKPLRNDELLAYLGLELNTSVHRLNRLSDYWCTSDLLGNSFFKKVLGRDTFMNIRAALRMYPAYEHEAAVNDPLWHSRQILEHFLRNCATFAVPVGVSSLDENTIRCKGRTGARSYMKSKPVKFGIRFYSVVGWSHAYLHSFQDNGSGNKFGQTPVQRYTNVFRNLRGAVERVIDGSLVAKSSPSALWCTQMAHHTKLHQTQDEGRLMVMDNFYTRRMVGRQLKLLSDGECRILGTVRFNNIDGLNRPALKEAIEVLKNAERGDWRLVQVLQRKNARDTTVEVAENTGFVVFKDRSVVSFYTNDLRSTATKRIHEADDYAVYCVHGLAPLHRWLGNEAKNRTVLKVPAIIVAYNLFMNGVDRFDQFRSTSATVGKEKRVTMSILTFILDACILNSHALLKAISSPSHTIVDVGRMKHRVIHQLFADYVEYKQQRASLSPIPAATAWPTCTLPNTTSANGFHVLLETVTRKSVHCMLCNLMSISGRGGYTMYSCSHCNRGFHGNCFSFYHQKEVLRSVRPTVYRGVVAASRSLSSKRRRSRRNTVTSSLQTARVIYK